LPSFTLPDHTPVDDQILRAIAARHGLDGTMIEHLPETGIINAIYRLGPDAILRVPRSHPTFVADSFREAVGAPAARAAGVRTPALLAFDDSLTLLPVPYTIYERVPGVPLESLGLDPDDAAEIWREHGRNLARAHVGVPSTGPVAQLEQRRNHADLPAALEKRVQEGWLSPLDARWLGRWLERLAPAALAPMPPRFTHGDTQATNLMVSTAPLRYEAIIDWGSASLGDVALDFAGVPLRAVPHMLAGHREVAPLDADETAEARIVWRHLDLVLGFMPRGAVPGRSWGERPLPMLLEVLRFFLDPPDERWRAVGPIERPPMPSTIPSQARNGGAVHV
jgi:aminoglycoside phosphotransferase (APT) family kinase protein